MNQAGMVEAVISCEKRWATKSMQQGDDIVSILHPETTDFKTNLSEVNLASAEPISFEDADVFIQNVHAARCRSSAFSMRASPASERTSAIAS